MTNEKKIHVLADESLGGTLREYVEIDNVMGGRVFEPTNIVHIDDSRFRLVDRKAEVGDKVIVINDGHLVSKGETHTVETPRIYENREKYRVLVPVEEESETSPQSIEDLIANLATRMTALERSVTALDDKHEAHAKQLVDIGRSTWYLEDDVKYAKDARYQLAVEIRDIKARLEATSNALRKGD